MKTPSTTGDAGVSDVETLKGLLERVRAAKGPDRMLDAHLICHLVAGAGCFVTVAPITGDVRVCTGRGEYTGADLVWSAWPAWKAKRVTGSLAGARALHRLALPDSWISSGLCALTGHASTGPDYNGPAGDRLREAWPEAQFHEGFHADLGPGDGPHRECYAILDVTLQALIARSQEASHAE